MSDEFDRLFDAAFASAAKKHTAAPSPEASWARVSQKLERRRARRSRLKVLPYAAVSFVLGAVLFASPTVSQAFDPFFRSVKAIPDGVVHIVFGSDQQSVTEPKTAPPPDFTEETGAPAVPDGTDVDIPTKPNAKYGSWEEANEAFAAPLPAVSYVPEGWKLESILVAYNPGQDKASTAIAMYAGEGRENYTITMRRLAEGEKLSSGSDQQDGVFETIKIGGTEAYLFLGKDGTSSLEYLSGGLYVAVVGGLSREQLIEIASHIG